MNSAREGKRAEIGRPDTDAGGVATEKAKIGLVLDQSPSEADQSSADADQTLSDADQSSADAEQTLSDADQERSADDQASADRDQMVSDHDQAASDREHAAGKRRLSATEEQAYTSARAERDSGSFERRWNRLMRGRTSHDRDAVATTRDRIAAARDTTAAARDQRPGGATLLSPDREVPVSKQLEELRIRAAAERARAAQDRERAAQERAEFARERTRLEAELRSAHLDDLTGTYRREMGRMALSHEIDRARRSGGQFVLAFVDVDRLKEINDRQGHAAGDHVLQVVVDTIRTRLRSFDPIIRYGGDEFICGLGGTDLAEAKARFDSIGSTIEAEAATGISVGLTALEADDTVESLTMRADAAMLKVKATHHAQSDG